MSDYAKQYQNMKADAAISAAKAVDYMDGLQQAPLETALDDDYIGISEWRERGVFPATENLTGKIVGRSALTYSEPPKRRVLVSSTIDQAATDTYSALLRESNWRDIAQPVDEIARLLKTAVVVPFWNEDAKALFFTVLGRHNCDVEFDARTGQIASLLYSSGIPGPNGGQAFYHITPEAFTDLELKAGSLKVTGGEPNPYGVVPAAWLYDTNAPRSGFWPAAAWEELVQFNLMHNIWLTSVGFNARWEAFSTPVTNADIKDGTRIGPDTPLKLKGQPGQDVYFKFESPTINLEPYAEFFKDYERRIADNWGVNIKHGEGSADSGFKLVVDEIWNLHTRQQRIGAAVAFERRLYNVVQKISDVHKLGLKPGTLDAAFPAPALPVNETEAWSVAQGELAARVLSRKDYMRRKHPDISDEDLETKLAEIDADQKPVLSVPDFGTGEE